MFSRIRSFTIYNSELIFSLWQSVMSAVTLKTINVKNRTFFTLVTSKLDHSTVTVFMINNPILRVSKVHTTMNTNLFQLWKSLAVIKKHKIITAYVLSNGYVTLLEVTENYQIISGSR